MRVELYVLLEDGDGFGEGGRPTVEHLLEAIAEGETVEDLVVELSALFVAETVVVSCEVVSYVSRSVIGLGEGSEVQLLSWSVIVPSKSVKRIILGFASRASGNGIVTRERCGTCRENGRI